MPLAPHEYAKQGLRPIPGPPTQDGGKDEYVEHWHAVASGIVNKTYDVDYPEIQSGLAAFVDEIVREARAQHGPNIFLERIGGPPPVGMQTITLTRSMRRKGPITY